MQAALSTLPNQQTAKRPNLISLTLTGKHQNLENDMATKETYINRARSLVDFIDSMTLASPVAIATAAYHKGRLIDVIEGVAKYASNPMGYWIIGDTPNSDRNKEFGMIGGVWYVRCQLAFAIQQGYKSNADVKLRTANAEAVAAGMAACFPARDSKFGLVATRLEVNPLSALAQSGVNVTTPARIIAGIDAGNTGANMLQAAISWREKAVAARSAAEAEKTRLSAKQEELEARKAALAAKKAAKAELPEVAPSKARKGKAG